LERISLKYHRNMILSKSNPYLRNWPEAKLKAALLISAKTSSAVDGIRAPFAEGRLAEAPASWEDFTAYWNRRAALRTPRPFRGTATIFMAPLMAKGKP
jgi:hypothetical protein